MDVSEAVVSDDCKEGMPRVDTPSKPGCLFLICRWQPETMCSGALPLFHCLGLCARTHTADAARLNLPLISFNSWVNSYW